MARKGSGNVRVSITGDSSGLRREVGQADRQLDRLGRAGTRTGKLFGTSAKHLAGYGAALVSIGAAKDAIATTEALAKGTAGLARITGQSTEEASRWIAVAKARGVESKALNVGFITLSKNIKAATDSGSGQAKMFRELGISQEAIRQGDTNRVLLETADAFEKMPSGANKAAIASKLFGKQAQTLLPLINQGSDALREQLELSDKYGTTLDKNQVKKALEAVAAQRQLSMAADGLKVAFATNVLPALASAGGAVADFISGLRSGEGAGGRFAAGVSSAFTTAKTAVGRAVGAISGFFRQNRADIDQVLQAFVNIGTSIRAVFESVVLPVLKRVWPGIVQIVQGALRTITGIVRVFSGVLTGDFGKAWDGVKGIFSGALKAIGGTIRAASAPLRAAVAAVVRPIERGFEGAFNGVKSVVRTAMRFILDRLNDFFTVASQLPGVGGKFKGVRDEIRRLRGEIDGLDQAARKALRSLNAQADVVSDVLADGPQGDGWGIKRATRALSERATVRGTGLNAFNSIAQRFGLTVGSGVRDGARTESGNVSYHALGRARDFPGPPGQMMAFARYLASNFGARLKELIYTPLGFSIKNGRRVAPFAQSQHYDHVHVAMRRGGGVPGSGSGDKVPALLEPGEFVMNRNATSKFGGLLASLNSAIPRFQSGGLIGKFTSTSYGPPWNAMNGTGVTATGRDLRPSKQAYGIAVDPRVIKLGTLLKVWPNPFNYEGLFRAFDTGGAIKGKRIDFYDWRGRAKQLGWGRKAVQVFGRNAKVGRGGGKGVTGPQFESGFTGTGGSSRPSNVGPEIPTLAAPGTVGTTSSGALMGSSGRYNPATGRVEWTPITPPPGEAAPGSGTDETNRLLEENNQLLQEQIRLERERTESLGRELATMRAQTPQFFAALAAIVSGEIGGMIGLGHATPAAAGVTAAY